ncbi:TPA: hypothetical protein ACWV7H_004660 [Salmonella enterica subsp. enterica serovar Muenchen]
MKFISKIKDLIRRASSCALLPVMSVFAASPAFAADGFTRANTIMGVRAHFL